MRKAEKDNRK